MSAGEGLAADRRAFEIDLDLEARAVIGLEFGPGGAAVDANRLDDADIAALDVERLDAGLVDGFDEGGGAAVEDRHFVAVDLDDEIVDAEAEQRGHDMLDRADMMAGGIAKRGAEVGGADFGDQRADFARLAAGVDMMEDDAGVGIGREESDGNRLAAVDAEPSQRHARFDCCLIIVQVDPHTARQPFLLSKRWIFSLR